MRLIELRKLGLPRRTWWRLVTVVAVLLALTPLASAAPGIGAARASAAPAPAPPTPPPAVPLPAYQIPAVDTINDTDIGSVFTGQGAFAMQATGPCDPMIGVLANATPANGQPFNQWGHPHTKSKWTSFDGGSWEEKGWGCGGTTYVNGTSSGPSVDASPLAWSLPCNQMPASVSYGGSQQAQVPGLECLGPNALPGGASQPVQTYGTPSPTVQLPVSCIFNYMPPRGYERPDANSNPPSAWRSEGTDYSQILNPDPDADNSGSPLDGNYLNCQVQAQGLVNNEWVNLGTPLAITAGIPPCGSTCDDSGVINEGGSLTIPLSQVEQPVRLAYSFYVGQSSTRDGGYTSDFPLGSEYCRWAHNNDPSSDSMKACSGDTSTVGTANGLTNTLMFVVEPTGEAQLNVLPYKILYQPPGDQSTASLSVSAGSTASTTLSLANSASTSHTSNSSLSIGASADIGTKFFSVNMDYTHTWETDVQSSHSQAGSAANTAQIDAFDSTTFTTPTPVGDNAVTRPELEDPAIPPWRYDTIEAVVHPQFGIWDMATCSSGVPDSSGPLPTCPSGSSVQGGTHWQPLAMVHSTVPLEVSKLIPCYQNNSPMTLDRVYGGAKVVISPAQCKQLISMDPFAATGLGLVSPKCPPQSGPAGCGPGQAADPSALLAAPGTARGNALYSWGSNGQPAWQQPLIKELKEIWTDTSTYDASSSFDSSVTDISTNTVSVSTHAKIPVPLFDAGVGGSVTYTKTNSTTGSVSVSYDKAVTASNYTAVTAKINLSDESYPMQTNLYLDPRWGSVMFQVPQTVVSSTSPSSGSDTTKVTLKGSGFHSGPIAALFCPDNGGSCVPGTNLSTPDDFTLLVNPPSFPPGTVTDVMVQSSGVKTAINRANRFAYVTPGSSLTPMRTDGRPGQVLELSGSGFSSGQPVSIMLSATAPVVYAKPTADSRGAFHTAIIVPQMAHDSYMLVASQKTGSTVTKAAVVNMTLGPTMALQPGSGAAGQAIATAVLGFPAADGLTLHWNSPTGPLLATIRTDGSGSAETSFKVPAVAPGAYTVEAVDPHGTRTVGFVVTVAATKPPTTTGMLTPSSTTPGGLIRLATNGFRPSEMVYVLIGGRVIDVTQADPSGGIDVPIVVPAGPAGQVPIQVIGVQTGPHGTQNLTVNRRLVLHPASGPASSVVTGSAFGFPSASTVRMRWNSPTGTVLATVQADTFGSVSGPLTIPSTAGPGPQAVYAIQSRGVRAVAGFRVT